MKRMCFLILCCAVMLGSLPAAALADGPHVEAKSAVLMEIATGKILCEQDAHIPLPPASVTKVMTMLLIMEAIDSERIHWEDMVTVSDTAAAKGGSQVFLKVGETMSVQDMVKSIAVSSANDCACAMAEHLEGSEQAFVDKMNQKAQSLGMKDTHFVNCTGLDDAPEAKEHLTSAYDIALMSRELLYKHPDIKKYTTIWMDTIRNGAFGLSNTNKMVRFYKGCTGLKTGFTSAAGYCLSASAKRDNMELAAVVMGCETPQKRLNACKQLLDYGFSSYGLVMPKLNGPVTVPVELGKAPVAAAEPAEFQPMLIDKGQMSLIRQEIEKVPSVQAPVSMGQKLGTLKIMAGDQILAEIPLLATAPVEKLSWWQIFKNLLAFGF